MKKLLLIIIKSLIVLGLIYGVLFTLGTILTWAENHFMIFMLVASPIVAKIIYKELKKF